MKHDKVETIKGEFVPSQSTVGQQIAAIEQLRVDILIRKKDLLDMEHRLGRYERGLDEMRRKLKNAA